jgi:2-oxoglutarate ferredoxin oxidoreductase subunit gamma
MYQDIIIAGFGGQGIMLMGRVLAYAGMKEGRRVLWIPSYGPEMRGGAANCTVILSDEEIGSPIVTNPGTVVAMNQPSLDRFEPGLKCNGLLFINSSMVNRGAHRKDIEALSIPATEIAKVIGEPKIANMVMLGALVAKTSFIKMETLVKVVEETLQHKTQLIPLNIAALTRGAQAVQEVSGRLCA